jgi:hypothetical protein
MLENYDVEMRLRYAEWLAERMLEEFDRMQSLRRQAFGVKLAKKLDDYTLGKAKYFHTSIEPKRQNRTRKKRRLTRLQKRWKKQRK